MPLTTTLPPSSMIRQSRPLMLRVSIRSVRSGLTLMTTSGVLTSKVRVFITLPASSEVRSPAVSS